MFAIHLEATKVLSGNTGQQMPYLHSFGLTKVHQHLPERNLNAFTDPRFLSRGHLQIIWSGGQQGLQLGVTQECLYLQSLKTSARGFWLQISLKVGAEIPPFGALTGLGSPLTTGTFQEEIALLRQSQRL